ncbi:MAG: hypothetical protein Q8R85_04720 [Bosea sp. (in: a-proteobacteria)]|uniref:hypothetical protein n=1 Tax=Bosea sp. (in: a-proteobacteria) TaxID=1871050 RepID=UPI002736A016|nr:hypothetical protein [Bosea sp. (in: a-proteobacteria)]MDP3600453.1 hypothetical protein [Bosea sp. (in: a-proteobacteria)]
MGYDCAGSSARALGLEGWDDCVIETKNDLASFVSHCLAAASQYIELVDDHAIIEAFEYSNIGIFISLSGVKIKTIPDSAVRAISAIANIDGSEATLMLHFDDREFHQLEMYFNAGGNLESWNRRIDVMQIVSGF